MFALPLLTFFQALASFKFDFLVAVQGGTPHKFDKRFTSVRQAVEGFARQNYGNGLAVLGDFLRPFVLCGLQKFRKARLCVL